MLVVVLTLIIGGATALGVYLGQRVRSHPDGNAEPVGVVQAAMLGLVGLLLAPMAGIVVATIASALDRRVLTTADLQRTMGCPTLAQVPRSRAVRRAHRAARPRLSDRLFPRLPLIGGRTRA